MRPVGRVIALRRYPIKSMAGEELVRCEVTERGLLGDRGYAIVDLATGHVGSAKNPRAWPDLLSYRANYTEPPQVGAELPPVRITLPDGQVLESEASERLSDLFGKPIKLSRRPPEQPKLEQFWPEVDGAPESVTEERMPAGTFFDLATVNLLTTTTLARLGTTYPTGDFSLARFRPNILVEPINASGHESESSWIGKILAIGDSLRLKIDARCTRCVMTTLGQPGLTNDAGILRTLVRVNEGCAGLNVSVVRSGLIRVGDWLTQCDEFTTPLPPPASQSPPPPACAPSHRDAGCSGANASANSSG